MSEKVCSRCSACCKVLPLPIAGMSLEHIKYLRTRGLKEDQGFFLIPQECQHLKGPVSIPFKCQDGVPFIYRNEYSCDIHDSPDRPMVCRRFHGQKQIGRFRIYIPPGCTMKEEKK